MFSILLIGAAMAAPCGPTAQARMDNAEIMLSEMTQMEVVEQFQVVEQAQTILERTTDDFPRCRAAAKMSSDVTALSIRLRPLAEEAAHDQMVERLESRISFMETNANPNRNEVRNLARMVSAMASRHPSDERIKDLSYRLAMLGGTR